MILIIIHKKRRFKTTFEEMENSIKIIKLNLNYVYEQLINEFINNNGYCNNSTYNLFNWKYILDSTNCKF